jgi:hypothetical protein
MATCAAFRKESRMKFANANNLDRKSGAAQRRGMEEPAQQQPPGFRNPTARSPQPYSREASMQQSIFDRQGLETISASRATAPIPSG